MWLFWCIYLIRGDVTENATNDTDVAFKNCAPFSKCRRDIKDAFIDEANHIYIVMPMYNLTEYSDDYSDTSGSLRQFKRDEIPANDDNLLITDSQSFKKPQIIIMQIVL